MKSLDYELIDNLNSSIRDVVQNSLPSGFKNIPKGESNVYLCTSLGSEREKNEDKIIFASIRNNILRGAPLMVAALADGMGGMLQGQRAASMAISSFIAYVAAGDRETGLKSLIKNALQYANKMVYQELKGKGGTTLSSVLYGRNGCVGVNVGDSRIYCFDKDIGMTKLTKLTVDDTISGQLYQESNEGDNWRNPFKGDNRLAQYVGMGDGIEPHLMDLDKYNKQNRNYLLTSDGAHYLGTMMLEKIINKAKSQEDIPQRIVSISEWLSGHDNSSAILLPSNISVVDVEQNTDHLQINLFTVSNEVRLLVPLKNFSRRDHIYTNKAQLYLFNDKNDRREWAGSDTGNNKKNESQIDQQKSKKKVKSITKSLKKKDSNKKEKTDIKTDVKEVDNKVTINLVSIDEKSDYDNNK